MSYHSLSGGSRENGGEGRKHNSKLKDWALPVLHRDGRDGWNIPHEWSGSPPPSRNSVPSTLPMHIARVHHPLHSAVRSDELEDWKSPVLKLRLVLPLFSSLYSPPEPPPFPPDKE
uniref:Uncharacterized protein n=1 Tax=Fagus sylvatica TaxID=28930 RepID=A0A2N9GFD5_FAGSY